jgi:threonine 3-dehydrogenase
MSVKAVLVTGACGEIGQALVQNLSGKGNYKIITADLAPLPESIRSLSSEHFQGDLVNKIKQFYDYDFDIIFHLAASLSSKAEIASEEAHRINVEGTMQLLLMAAYKSEKYHKAVKFIFPSSIAVYGFNDLVIKHGAGQVKENDFNEPHTMYGCNKLYCEKLGLYYSHFNGQHHLDDNPPTMLDFRAIRFPGLISAFTKPSGGTSDYGPEMLHAAAQGLNYPCFVRKDSIIPFMAMPDAIKSLIMITEAPRENISHPVYNIRGFSITADEFRKQAMAAFSAAQISFAPNKNRQGIIDSWPEDVDDTAAQKDWGWKADYDEKRFFEEYFIPEIRRAYSDKPSMRTKE